MTDLDWPPVPVDDTALERKPRKCRHPKYRRQDVGTVLGAPSYVCGSCGVTIAEFAIRRGRSARRLGGDQERRIERVYGPVKRGEFGDPVDHVGRVWRWQSKATRSLPPRWLAAYDVPRPRDRLPSSITGPLAGMAGMFDPRRSVVIRSFVSRGIRTRDWLFVGYRDAEAELGAPRRLPPAPWWVIPGDWWLDHFGRDE